MDEEQQKLINGIQKAAHEAVVAAHAKEKIFQEKRPEHQKVKASILAKEYESKLNSLQTDARDSGIPDNAVDSAIARGKYRAKEAIKSGGLKTEIEKMKSALTEINTQYTGPKNLPDNETPKEIKLNDDERALVPIVKQVILQDEINSYAWLALSNEPPVSSLESRLNINNLLKKSSGYKDLFKAREDTAIDKGIFDEIVKVAKAEIKAETGNGNYVTEINRIKGEVHDFSKKELIDNSRKLLHQLASGATLNDTLLAESLQELKNNHRLGAEVLDPAYPQKPHKTAEQMQAVIDSSVKNGKPLFEAREALDKIKFGRVDVKESIEIINDRLSSAGFGYEALDKNFDPNNPGAPHKSAQEMKEEIKATVDKGNKAREELIRFWINRTKSIQKVLESDGIITDPSLYPKQYPKPDYELNLDSLLNLPEMKLPLQKEVIASVIPAVAVAKPDPNSNEFKSEIEQIKSKLPKLKAQSAPVETKEVAATVAEEKKLTPEELALAEELKKIILLDKIRENVSNQFRKEATEASGKAGLGINNLVSNSPVLNNLFKQSDEYNKDLESIKSSIGNPETFNKLFAKSQAKVAKEITEGNHDKAIYLLAEKTYNEQSAWLKEAAGISPKKLIDDTRKLFQKITSGNSGDTERLAKKLGELEKYHGFGAKVLDPDFDDPSKTHKTNEQMKIVMALSIEKGVALYKARQDLDRMASGEYDVKRSIESINKNLFSVSLGYDALDKAFDPNNPDAPHKTVQEMKDVIKAAVKKGNEAREVLIQEEEKNKTPYQTFNRYSKPDYNLNIDALLSVEVRKTSSLSSDDNKFAAMMEGVMVSPLILANSTSFIPTLPRNGNGQAIV